MNKHSIKQTQSVLLQPDYVSILPDETKKAHKQLTSYALHCVEPVVLTFAESRSVFVFFFQILFPFVRKFF